jgi:hypothetical protein
MKNFVLKLTAFFIMQLLLIGWAIAPYRPNPDMFWAGTTLKDEILSRAQSPRMIFIGGSNVAFGVDSELIANQLPYFPVNMGLDAGLGLDFSLNEIKDELRPGDIVVLSPEYEFFLGLRSGQESSLARVLEQRPANTQYLAVGNVTTLSDHGFGFFHWVFMNARKRLDRKKITGPYSLSAFNEYGDAVAHLDRRSRPDKAPAMEAFQRTPLDDSTLGVLNRFRAFCQKRNVELYLSHPPLPAYYAERQSRLAEVEQKIYQRASIPVLDKQPDMFFPIDQFYDTEYHLLRKARDIRTRHLIVALRNQLAARLSHP